MTISFDGAGFAHATGRGAGQGENPPQRRRKRNLTILGLAFVLLSSVLSFYPEIDMETSTLVSSANDFPLADVAFLKSARDMHRGSLGYVLAMTLLSIVVYALSPRLLPVLSPHRALLVLASFGIGALVLVHSLKVLVGRARPHDVMQFGGGKVFTPLWQFSDMCSSSCSFPSGESAAAAALLSFFVYFSQRRRWAFMAAIVPVAAFLSMNRIMFGAHFLSDVVLAWVMVLFVVVGLWRCIEPHAAAIDARVRLAGDGARRLIFGCGERN